MDTSPNVAQDAGEAREGDFPIGCRVSGEDLRRIDLAKVYAGFKTRADFIESAVVEKAERVLAAQSVVEARD